MLQSDSIHNPEPASVEATGSRRRKTIWRILEYLAMVAVVAIAVYVVVFAVKVAEGVKRTAGTPSQVVRLQLLNGCGVTDLCADIQRRLDGFTDAVMEIRVVDTGSFDVRTVKKSFVISRSEDLAEAKALAGKLGLLAADVVYQPLVHNLQHVSATLVLGQDYPSVRTLNNLSQEK